MGLTLDNVIDGLNAIAPLRYAAPWDNVGLLIEPVRPRRVQRALLTIDLTEPVLEEAIDAKAELIVAYHPPLFASFKRLTTADVKQRIALRCIDKRIAVYSPHTALDAAPGGVNDWLVDGLGEVADSEPIEASADQPPTQQCKIVTFVPHDAADGVRQAMSSSGAGVIGDYEQCSFNIPGTGTFLGSESTNPTVGQRGRLERVEETRLEMVCGRGALGGVIAALRDSHPYEEPPIEVYDLQPHPLSDTGMGRLATLKRQITLGTLVRRLKQHLGLKHMRLAAAEQGRARKIQRIAVCPGAGGSLFEQVDADLYLTGEMRHHDVLSKVAQGSAVILTDHTNTERGYLPTYRNHIATTFDHELEITLSQTDRDPLRIV